RRTKRLNVSHAFHSPLMDPMLEAFRKVAETVEYQAPRLTFISNVTGTLAGSEVATADYWVRHVRASVRFADAVKSLGAMGVNTLIEVGPQATLLGLVPASWTAAEEALLLPSSVLGQSESKAMLKALGGWYVHGGAVTWAEVFPEGGRAVELPTYPWQRERYWIENKSHSSRHGRDTGHPLLGVRLPTAGEDALYESILSVGLQPWLADHSVGGRAVLAGTAIAELIRAAAIDHLAAPAVELQGLVIQTPLVLPEAEARRVQVVVKSDERKISVYSQPAASGTEAKWALHASAQFRRFEDQPAMTEDLAAVKERCTDLRDVSRTHHELSRRGLSFGPSFQALTELRAGAREAFAEVALPPEASRGEFGVHPALLDAALRGIVAAMPAESRSGDGTLLPFEFGRLVVHRPGAEKAQVHVRLRGNVPEGRVKVRIGGKIGTIPRSKLDDYRRDYAAEVVP
ncbi:MAG: polyketide synthase dehydratase domain-containing protein, partial [Myxococcaceae bacterium]